VATDTVQRQIDQPRVGSSALGHAAGPDLCREFVEEILCTAVAEAAAVDPGAPAPIVDWESILGAAEGARTPEGTVGAVVLAASAVGSAIVKASLDSTSTASTGQSVAYANPPAPPPAPDALVEAPSQFLDEADERSWDWGPDRPARRRLTTRAGVGESAGPVRRLRLALARKFQGAVATAQAGLGIEVAGRSRAHAETR